jgi:hypothetical protein
MTANKDITELAAAWDRFCDDLKAAGRIPLREQVPPYALDRAAGFQQIARNISLALQFNYEYKDPLFPELARYFDPTRKQGGDNSDCVYVGAQINGTDRYRISGDRGSSRYFSVVAVETGATPWGGRVVSTLYGHELKAEVDGSFELLIGPDPQPGNWLRTTPDTFRVTIRQYFADWENERPLRAQIDRISGPALPPPLLSPVGLARGLGDAGRWLQDSIEYWPAMLEKWKDYPNQFRSYWQLEKNRIDATPGGDPLICYWQLPAEEVLIIRVVPPNACSGVWNSAIAGGRRWTIVHSPIPYALCAARDDGELIVVVAYRSRSAQLAGLLRRCRRLCHLSLDVIGTSQSPCEQLKFSALNEYLLPPSESPGGKCRAPARRDQAFRVLTIIRVPGDRRTGR